MRNRIDKRKIKIPYEILDEYYWGRSLSIQEVADELGCSYGTIRKNLIRYHIPIRKAGQTKTKKVSKRAQADNKTRRGKVKPKRP